MKITDGYFNAGCLKIFQLSLRALSHVLLQLLSQPVDGMLVHYRETQALHELSLPRQFTNTHVYSWWKEVLLHVHLLTRPFDPDSDTH